METGQQEPWVENYESSVRPTLQYPEIPIPHLMDRAVRQYPQRIATNFNGTTISYSALNEEINKLAAALSQLGVKKGDRVGMILPNSPQAVISYFASLKLGAIVVMMNPLNVEMELAFFIRDAQIRNLIIVDTVYRRITNIKDKIDIDNLIVTGIHDYLSFPYNILYPLKKTSDGHSPDIPRKEGIHRFSQLIRNAQQGPPEVSIDPKEDLAVLQYTGGNTGTPKGAMLTHYNIVCNVLQFREWFSALREGEERILSVLPFSHIYGLTCVLNFGFYIAATLVLMPRFEIEKVLKTISKTRPTFFPGVPTMYVALNNQADLKKHDISSVEYWNSGGAPLPLEVLEKFERRTGKRLIEGYGLAEASPVTHSNPVKGRRKLGSIGLPIPDTQSTIVDLELGEKEMGVGDVGELIIKGPQLMKGYWNNQEETDWALRDGWLYTGDIAQKDRDGYFFILNRKKELIISGGYNIYPREVEGVLQRHPKVQEAVVIGIPDDYYGEVVKAFIFSKGGKMILEDELRDFCLNKLAPYKIPRIFDIRKELPRKNLRGAELRRYLTEKE